MPKTNPNTEHSTPELEDLLNEMQQVPPREAKKAAFTRARFYSAVDTKISGSHTQNKTNPFSRFKETYAMFTPKLRAVVTTSIIILLIGTFLFGSAGITAAVAARALPGDTLYPVKTSINQARLQLTSSIADRVNLNLKFAQLHLDELKLLIANNRYGDLEEAISAYESRIQKALSDLSILQKQDPQAAELLYSNLVTTLNEYAVILQGLSIAIPREQVPLVEGAIHFSQSAGQYVDDFEFTGFVEEMTPEYWLVSGHKVFITTNTEIEDGITIGHKVKVEAWTDAAGSLFASEIDKSSEYDELEMDDDQKFIDYVEEITPTYWMINGLRFNITPETEVVGTIKVGDLVKVKFAVASDGSYYLLKVKSAYADDDMDDDLDDDMDDDLDDDMDDDVDDDMDDDVDDDMDDDADDMDDDLDDDMDDDLDDDMDDDLDDDDDDDETDDD